MKRSFSFYAFVLMMCFVVSSGFVLAQPGLSWEFIPGTQNAEITAMKVSNNTLYVATDSKVYVMRNNALKQIFPIASDQNLYIPASLDVDGQRILVGTFGSGAFLSEDGGLTWRQFNQGLGMSFPQVIGVHIVRGSAQSFRYIMCVDGYGMFISDGGAWREFNAGITMNIGSSSRVIVPDNRLGFVIGTMANGLLYSLGYNFFSGERQWVSMEQSLAPGDAVYDLEIAGDTMIVGSNLGVRISTNQGRTWRRSTTGVRGESRAFFDIEKVGATLYAGSNGFISNIGYVYASHDGGASWYITNASMPMSNLYALASDHEYLYAGTENGLFRARIAQATSVRGGGNIAINISHAPNPVVQDALIRFSLAKQGLVSITLHDMTGRHIAILAEGVYGAGQCSVALDAQRLGLSSGMYTYRMSIQGETIIRPLVVVR